MPWNIDISKPPVRVTTHDEAMIAHAQYLTLGLGGMMALMFQHADDRMEVGLEKVCSSIIEAMAAIPWESQELADWYARYGGDGTFRRVIKYIRAGSKDHALRLVQQAAETPLLVHIVDNTVPLVEDAR